jgi:hypothetical protein
LQRPTPHTCTRKGKTSACKCGAVSWARYEYGCGDFERGMERRVCVVRVRGVCAWSVCVVRGAWWRSERRTTRPAAVSAFPYRSRTNARTRTSCPCDRKVTGRWGGRVPDGAQDERAVQKSPARTRTHCTVELGAYILHYEHRMRVRTHTRTHPRTHARTPTRTHHARPPRTSARTDGRHARTRARASAHAPPPQPPPLLAVRPELPASSMQPRPRPATRRPAQRGAAGRGAAGG